MANIVRAELLAGLRTRAVRIYIEITSVHLYVELWGVSPGLDEEAVAAVLPRFDGYAWVEGRAERDHVWGHYLRTAAQPCNPYTISALRGSLLGRAVVFRLDEAAGPGQVRCTVLSRKWSSTNMRRHMAATLAPLLDDRVHTFLMGRLRRGRSVVNRLPAELVEMIVGHVRLRE